MNEPIYEIWGGWTDDAAFGAPEEFLEDCCSLEEVKKALKEYRKSGRYARAIHKETRESVNV